MKRRPRHKKLSTKARRRRHVRKHTGRINGETTVYAAGAGWRDSDTSMMVAGFDAKHVEKKIGELMDAEAKRAYDDELYESVDEAADGIAYYGVHAFALKDLTSSRDIDEAIRDLKDNGYFYPETP